MTFLDIFTVFFILTLPEFIRDLMVRYYVNHRSQKSRYVNLCSKLFCLQVAAHKLRMISGDYVRRFFFNFYLKFENFKISFEFL